MNKKEQAQTAQAVYDSMPMITHHIRIDGVELDPHHTDADGVGFSFKAPQLDVRNVIEATQDAMKGSMFADHVVEKVVQTIVRTHLAEFLAERAKVQV